jgi:hypothetical protein
VVGGFGECNESATEAAQQLVAEGCEGLNVIFALVGLAQTLGEDSNVTIRIGEPTATPADVGGLHLTAEECQFDGPSMTDVSHFSGPSLQIADDGTFYILDSDGGIRAYDAVPGAGCELRLRSDFGQEGVLRLEHEVDNLSVDARSVLHVGTRGHTVQIVNGEPGPSCRLPGNVRWLFGAAPDGTWGLTFSRARRADFNEEGCVVENPSSLVQTTDSVSTVTITDDRIWLGLQNQETRTFQVVAYDHQNNELLRFGGNEPFAEDGFGSIRVIAPCSSNLCILEGAFPNLKVWSTAGELIGAVDLVDLLGLSQIIPNGFAMDADGAGYVLVWEGMGTRRAHLFRINGL